MLACGTDGLLTVACLGDHLDIAGGLEHGFEPGPHHRLIIGDDDSQRGHDAVGA